MEPHIDDAEKAMLLLEQLCFCMSGKKQDHSVVFSKGYEKKASAPSGPAAGSFGMLHSFLTGASILQTVWLNLLTAKEIAGNALWTEGVGVPPWEKMPEGEADAVSEKLKSSLMGRPKAGLL